MSTPKFETDWLKKWSMYAPKSIALKDADNGREYSYGELFETANFLAGILRDRYGIKQGDRVAILSINEPEYVNLYYATMRLGAILVPVNYRLTPREIGYILTDSSPKLLIHQRQFQETVNNLPKESLPPQLWHFDGSDSLVELLAKPRDPKATPVLSMDSFGEATPYMILYTSGTTGAPKGAVLTHGMLFWNSINSTLRLNLSQSDVTLAFAPFFHTGGWNVLFSPLIHRGGKNILLRKFEADRILELCDQEGVTILFGVPTMMDMMYHSPAFANVSLKSVRYAIVGGEPMPIPLIKIWEGKGIPIRQGFGMTEFGPGIFSLNEEDSIRKAGSIGFPNFYVDVKIVGENDVELTEPNQIGELVLSGPACCQGYWNRPDATASSIKNGWLYTGDLVRRDEEGYFYVVGRKKDMYISGGENVYPAEIEQYLRTHPAVREAAVIGVADAKWGEVGRAFLSFKDGQSATEAEMTQFCQAGLAKFKCPKQFRFMKELPKGDSGKIQKKALVDLP